MAKHSSLKLKRSELKQRNVLKRYERLALALKKSKQEELDVFKLPKLKRKRLKGVKKEVKKEEVKKEGIEQIEQASDEKAKG